MRESKAVIMVFLKSFVTLNENALEAIPAKIEFTFSILLLKGAACKKRTLISSLATYSRAGLKLLSNKALADATKHLANLSSKGFSAPTFSEIA